MKVRDEAEGEARNGGKKMGPGFSCPHLLPFCRLVRRRFAKQKLFNPSQKLRAPNSSQNVAGPAESSSLRRENFRVKCGKKKFRNKKSKTCLHTFSGCYTPPRNR
jgi:hypothetical protein